MKINGLTLLTSIAAFCLFPNIAGAEEPSPEALLDAMSALAGKPQNVRVAHEKGVGGFAAAPEAKAISKAALFSAATTPALVRFSIAGTHDDIGPLFTHTRQPLGMHESPVGNENVPCGDRCDQAVRRPS